MDGSGTHSGNSDSLSEMRVSQTPIHLTDIRVCENKEMYFAFSRFYGKGQNKGIKEKYRRFKSFVRRLLGVDYR